MFWVVPLISAVAGVAKSENAAKAFSDSQMFGSGGALSSNAINAGSDWLFDHSGWNVNFGSGTIRADVSEKTNATGAKSPTATSPDMPAQKIGAANVTADWSGIDQKGVMIAAGVVGVAVLVFFLKKKKA